MLRKGLSLFICLFLAVNLCGCALLFGAAAGGAGTAFWLSGKLGDKVNVPYGRAIDAAKSALKSLNMEVLKETRSEKVAQIKSEYSDGRIVWIDIRKVSEESSGIEVRVGAKGDKAASGKILDQIKRYL